MNEEDKLIQNLQRKVTESRTNLDARTLGQLRAARLTAIESLSKATYRWWQLPVIRYVLPSAMAIALTVSIILPQLAGQTDDSDVELVAISDDIELLEDLDFYLWIIDSVENES